MKMKDIINEQVVAIEHSAAALNADADGTGVDLQGYQTCLFTAIVGVGGITFDADNKLELEIEESDDNETFTDVADADLSDYVAGTNDGCFGVVDAATDDDAVFQTQYKGGKRYCRAVLNFVGTHATATPVAVISQKFGADVAPAA